MIPRPDKIEIEVHDYHRDTAHIAITVRSALPNEVFEFITTGDRVGWDVMDGRNYVAAHAYAATYTLTETHEGLKKVVAILGRLAAEHVAVLDEFYRKPHGCQACGVRGSALTDFAYGQPEVCFTVPRETRQKWMGKITDSLAEIRLNDSRTYSAEAEDLWRNGTPAPEYVDPPSVETPW